MTEEYRAYGHRLEQYIADTPPIAWEALDAGGMVMFEGAQGALLDIDHGTYPFVTSSNPSPARPAREPASGPRTSTRSGHRQGLHHARGRRPVPHRARRRVGDRLVEAGGEFGTTTGRRRRTGWLDLVTCATRHASTRSPGSPSPSSTCSTGIDPLSVAISYIGPEGAALDEFPYHQSVLHKVTGDLRGAARAGKRTSRAALARGPARRTRRPTWSSSPTSWACRSCWSAWARRATR